MANHTKLAGAGAFVALLLAAPALADFHENWDSDTDGVLAQEEFGAGFDALGAFDRWDADADGALSREEFNAGLLGLYDEDASGAIEEVELGPVGEDLDLWDVDGDGIVGDVDGVIEGDEEDEYGNLDADADGQWSEEEFRTGFGVNFGRWDEDGDGTLSEEEYSAGAFEGYDMNDDGFLDEEERVNFMDGDGDGFWRNAQE